MKSKLFCILVIMLISQISACSNTVELSKALPNDPDFAPILPEMEEEAIMGFDFMKKHNVEWRWADQTLQICQSKIPCDMDLESTPRRVARISTRTSMIIPP